MSKVLVLLFNFLKKRSDCVFHPHLKLIHDLADAFATGANNASMDPAVQGDVFRDHLLQLAHKRLDGLPCSYGFVLIPCNSNLILWRNSRQLNINTKPCRKKIINQNLQKEEKKEKKRLGNRLHVRIR